jgi:hypothetical protein
MATENGRSDTPRIQQKSVRGRGGLFDAMVSLEDKTLTVDDRTSQVFYTVRHLHADWTFSSLLLSTLPTFLSQRLKMKSSSDATYPPAILVPPWSFRPRFICFRTRFVVLSQHRPSFFESDGNCVAKLTLSAG